MTSEAFKLKGLSEQVYNDFFRYAGVRLQARLVREAKEKAKKEAEEKARLEEEQRIREAEEKAAVEVVATVAAAEAEANAKAKVEEAARIAAEEAAKASADALTQGEQSKSGFAPLLLKTLEELQKEQQVVRASCTHTKRFDIKVTIIEEAHIINNIKVDELIGSLLTFEMDINDKIEIRNKGVAFKADVENYDEWEEEDTNDNLSKSIALLEKRFGKVMRRLVKLKRIIS
ncbi:eukaryotic translation initiation factor 4 gamma-like [Lathyrus oleraceus]|uniref:eukaryotic translation initiation factor 4 gamma-like n=1 Tax=Pisum sativum TaxID=3888 RepID=UPI0021D08FBE|nr:eukaryotic translation initiation factor 4 gamma-like [Pisum sativum]